MKCYAQFHYGSGYAPPEADDYEPFSSLREAGAVLQTRADRDPYYPCIDAESASALVWIGEPDPDDPFPCDGANHYPDYQITLGPRGGIRIERA